MAQYNYISSDRAGNDFVEGTSVRDSIHVIGNYSTVKALEGDDVITYEWNDNGGIWIGDEESNLYGGEGKDLFYIPGRYEYITITGGAGIDTLEVKPGSYFNYNEGEVAEIVFNDFSNDEVFRLDDPYYYSDEHRVLTQRVENGNVVLSDNSSVKTVGDEELVTTVDPTFEVTLQGVSNISQVANAKYYRYSGNSPQEYKTSANFSTFRQAARLPILQLLQRQAVQAAAQQLQPKLRRQPKLQKARQAAAPQRLSTIITAIITIWTATTVQLLSAAVWAAT